MPTTITDLLALMIPANEAYRNSKPIMTDARYDELEDELTRLIALGTDPNVAEGKAFLAGIGAPVPVNSAWVKVRHTAPMTSLNKAQNEAELRAWAKGVDSSEGFSVSAKGDGISISLIYANGALLRAVTRGDGDVGEDITRNVRKMKGVSLAPQNGYTGPLRGEIALKKSDWKTYFPGYSNPRNAAAGIAKDQDGPGAQHLTVLHYQCLPEVGGFQTKEAEFLALEAMGCETVTHAVFATIDEVIAYYHAYIDKFRDELDYLIDGLVVSVNSLKVLDDLGDLNKRPRGAIAFKFPAEAKETFLIGIKWQVGKSGRVTPVAEFEMVNLSGANISNASLHNLSNIYGLVSAIGQEYLFVGDKVVVSRRNDVIPYLEEVLETNLPEDAVALKPPTNCPACNAALVMQGEYLMCLGEDCPAQVLGGISRWVTKIGVLGLGESVIAALIEHANVTDAADLYTLDPAKLESIPSGSGRMGATAHNIVKELQSKKEMPLHTFVGSLGIPLCARSVCKMIADAGFDSLEKMQAATVADIEAVPGLGGTKAAEFVRGLAARQTLIDKLIDNGVIIKRKAVGSLTGQSVCLTGFRSPDMEKAVEDAGGSVKNSVGKGLTFLVCKDPGSGSEKLKKAVSYGVKVVSVDDMWTIIKGSASV